MDSAKSLEHVPMELRIHYSHNTTDINKTRLRSSFLLIKLCKRISIYVLFHLQESLTCMSIPLCPVIKKPGEQPQLHPALSDHTTFVSSGSFAF